jgi:hypothetical protein
VFEVDAPPPTEEEAAQLIRCIIAARRHRDSLFDEGTFADPAWDMMLDLALARLEAKKVSISSLCLAAAVPPTTALRWVGSLSAKGIFVRIPDPTDARRVFVEISEEAFARVLQCLPRYQPGDGGAGTR